MPGWNEKKMPVPTEESKKRAIRLCDIALEKKVLYHQCTEKFQANLLNDEAIFADADHGEGYYVYMKLTSVAVGDRVYLRDMSAARIDPSDLLASLANGEYSEYDELPRTHPDAERIMEIYYHLRAVVQVRGIRATFVTKVPLLPPPHPDEDSPKNRDTPTVEYL